MNWTTQLNLNDMSDEILFRVVFNGRITGEYDLDTTRQHFQSLFRLDEKKVAKIFAAREVILKDSITERVAMNYAIKLAEIGCECYIEEVPRPDDISTQPGFVERRKGERRLRFRRAARPGAIVPDRRVLYGRRKTDKPKEGTRIIGAH